MGKMLKYAFIFLVYVIIGAAVAWGTDVSKANFIWGIIGWPIIAIKFLMLKLA